MTTGYVSLPIPGGMAPLGTEAPCGWAPITSSGGAVTNGASMRHMRALFDQSIDEHWLWPLVLPGDFVSFSALRLKYGSLVTSGAVVWKGSLIGVVDGTDDTDTLVMGAVATTAGLTVPGTSGFLADTTVVPTATGLAANRLTVVMIGRDANNGSDTAAGDCFLAGALLEYVR